MGNVFLCIMFKRNLFSSRVQIHDVAEKVVFCRFFYDYRGKINEFSLGVVFCGDFFDIIFYGLASAGNMIHPQSQILVDSVTQYETFN